MWNGLGGNANPTVKGIGERYAMDKFFKKLHKNFATTNAQSMKFKLPERLKKNVLFDDVLPARRILEPANYTRTPFLKQLWNVQFSNRSFFFFGNAWSSAVCFAAFLWWSRIFDPPPAERLDRYWLNSPRFRILSAYFNNGCRPGSKIAQMTHEVRYFHKGIDHPFNINETKDVLFKMRENLMIKKHPTVQYPYAFRQVNKVSTPGDLKVHVYPAPQAH